MRKFLASAVNVSATLGVYSVVTVSVLLCVYCYITRPENAKGIEAYEAGDYAAALQEFRPLAEAGNSTAQFNLGWMYESGEGAPQDYEEAAKWYRKAAEQGNASAQYRLGWMYYTGQGVPKTSNRLICGRTSVVAMDTRVKTI